MYIFIGVLLAVVSWAFLKPRFLELEKRDEERLSRLKKSQADLENSRVELKLSRERLKQSEEELEKARVELKESNLD